MEGDVLGSNPMSRGRTTKRPSSWIQKIHTRPPKLKVGLKFGHWQAD